MTDKPIMFSGPMVRALLDGKKTQTRRLLRKPSIEADLSGHDRVFTWFAPPHVPSEGVPDQWAQSGIWAEKLGPLGYLRYVGPTSVRPADRLWVREAWQYPPAPYCSCPQPTEPSPCDDWRMGTGCVSNRTGGVIYRADGATAPRWRPSRHMPRWASRITLVVTDVRVQRLQDISEADAKAEGAEDQGPCDHQRQGCEDIGCCGPGYRGGFHLIWASIHGPDAWQTNPWVMAITFEVHQCNIDRLTEAEVQQ
ncbi:MAG: hypothetical protein EAZ99_07900 [Alphaproteobacteria bacterium]|nr:MAG: hypothetical protein EAZ99_07900 [Alphaproteobacteria bacterium]